MKTLSANAEALKTNFLLQMLGPEINEALNDDAITEIMVNPDGRIWLESRTKGMYSPGYLTEFAAQNFLLQLARLRDLFLHAEKPYIETLLPFHGERLEGTIAPISARAAFTIRKPAKVVYALEDYLAKSILTKTQFEVIEQALVERKNLVISGGPGTGKTTLTNAIVKHMTAVCDVKERVLVLEDTAEIQCEMPNVLSMVTSQTVSMRDLLKIAMRSRPDRILVGEVRDAAALDLLKAWNTGCPGGIATVHANSTESTLLRLLSLSEEAGVPPPYALVAETVQVLVNLVRDPKHPAGRRVSAVSKVLGFSGGQFQFDAVA